MGSKARKAREQAAAEAQQVVGLEEMVPEQVINPETGEREEVSMGHGDKLEEEMREAAAAQAAPEAPAGVKVLKVRKGLKYKGARQAWYTRLCEYDGKPLAEFEANVTSNRPSCYQARSKHCGNPEPVRGWVRFFERNGVFTEV